MRRLLVSVASLSLVGAGLFHPALSAPQTSPTDGITGGTATIVVGQDASGFPTWTITLNGPIAAGGRVYSGTASGTREEDNPSLYYVDFSGSSPSGSVIGTCNGIDQPDPRQILGVGAAAPPAPPAGLLDLSCYVSIDGAANAPLQLFIALAPAGINTYAGPYAAAPDNVRPDTLPTVPVVSFGYSDATTYGGPNGSDISFTLTGQITLGDQTFHGTASGTTSAALGSPLPPFTLSGVSPSGSLTATCTEQFVTTGGSFAQIGVALSVLRCDGSANGGAPGHATLVSVYRLTSDEAHFGETTTYDGAFVGL